MKRLQLTLITILFLTQGYYNTIDGQDITFTFANAENTNDGVNDYYEVDVLISSTTDFKLGSGQIYLTYNTAAFGVNVFANGNIEYTYPNGTHILGEHEKDFNFGDLYTSYVTNDNTDDRVSFAWQQSYSSEVYSGNNVTSTATNLFHVKMKYADVNEDPNVCFESGAVYIDQTYTACGSSASGPLTSSDCANYPGIQLLNDSYDCSMAVLPVELLYFTGEAQEEDVLLQWETATEINNSHFEVEHSTNGFDFNEIEKVEGMGTTTEQQYYNFLHESPIIGKNYYRLRQVDFDGQFEYTNTIVVSFNEEDVVNNIQLAVFPNPTINILNIKTESLDIENIRIVNVLGQVVFEQQNLNNNDLHQINVAQLPSGTYHLQINGNEENVTFIKE